MTHLQHAELSVTLVQAALKWHVTAVVLEVPHGMRSCCYCSRMRTWTAARLKQLL